MAKLDFLALARKFEIYGDFVLAVPFGTGHINDTYQLTFNQGGTLVHYTLQRINTNVFKDPVSLMDNVARVTAHLSGSTKPSVERSRTALQLLRTADSKPYVIDEDGNYFRGYIFVENARTYDILENDNQAFAAAQAFGKFQCDLVNLPGPRLHETIKDFHNTPKRFEALQAAIKQDKCGRVREVGREIDFVLAREKELSTLLDLQKSGEIPERITHNDTKLNNVLIDDFTGRGICVIDLDTVMPGLAHYDFGDMVRTGTSPAAEDEVNLDHVFMQFNRFEALLRGYLAGAGKFLNPVELAYLPFSGKLITLEIGIRFLTDYLEGDVYFKTHRPGHNLDRCRSQFKLAASIEQQMDAMRRLLDAVSKEEK